MLNKNKILILTAMGIITNLPSNSNAQTFYQCMPIICNSGEYLDSKENKCKTCPDGYYQTANNHIEQSCQPCKTVTVYYDRWYDKSPYTYTVSSAVSANFQYEKTYNCNFGASSKSACMLYGAYGSGRIDSNVFSYKNQNFKMICDKETGKVCAIGARTICL
ncbi:hypothetical protein HDR59_04500 [bacterium]|nr:hypothetical protein [bacterium]